MPRIQAMKEIDVFLPQIVKSIPHWDILMPVKIITCENVLAATGDYFIKWLVEELIERSEGTTGYELKEKCQNFLLELETDICAMARKSFEWCKE